MPALLRSVSGELGLARRGPRESRPDVAQGSETRQVAFDRQNRRLTLNVKLELENALGQKGHEHAAPAKVGHVGQHARSATGAPMEEFPASTPFESSPCTTVTACKESTATDVRTAMTGWQASQ